MKSILAPFRDPLKRRFILAGICGCLAIVVFAGIFIRQTDRFFLRMKGEHLTYLAERLAERIDADAHTNIRSPADMKGDTYRTISTALEEMQKLTTTVISSYTLRIVNGEAFLIVSPPADYDRNGRIEGELEERDAVGTPYGEPPNFAMREASDRGKVAFNPTFASDRWGTWLTGCAPLRTAAGPIDGAVCVDEDAGRVRADMRRVDAMTAALAALTVLLLVTSLVGYLRARLELAGRSRAEAARERALRRFEAAIENTPSIAVHGFDRNGTILLWNNASRKIYGFTREEALGRDICLLLFQESEEATCRSDISSICSTRRPLTERVRTIITREGEALQVQSTMFPVVEDGEVVEIFCMDIDVSEDRKARYELQKGLDRMKTFSDMMVGRESRMIELKREINELCDKLGIERRYTI